jgi:hypothetical protein
VHIDKPTTSSVVRPVNMGWPRCCICHIYNKYGKLTACCTRRIQLIMRFAQGVEAPTEAKTLKMKIEKLNSRPRPLNKLI